VRDPEKYRGEKVVIAGGGDSALDWAIFLADVAAEVVLVHRRSKFRGAPDSVEKVKELSKKGHIEIVTNAQVVGLEGKGILEGVVLREEGKEDLVKEAAYFIPLFGLSPKLGPISEWGLNIENNAIEVDPKDYSTNVPGIFAIGDINTYPGKLKLILCGFHEATLMSQAAFRFINPEQKPSLKYTTVTGVTGFDE
jgi:thioredoxin reductase (NADPH)